MPPPPSLSTRLLAWIGRAWGRVEAGWARLLGRARRRRRQLTAEARILGAEVLQLGAQLWVPARLPAAFKLTPIRTQFYGHGAFMGAAPALVADARWRRIVGLLMPDVAADLREAIEAGCDPARLMPMMENNPVLAAFGVTQGAAHRAGDESPLHLSGIEWDLFVEAEQIAAWEAATDDEARGRVMARVLDTALIAHASPADTVQEAMGICQYRDVRKTRKTALGGVELDAWLVLFGRALFLGAAADLDAACAELARDPRCDSDEECMRFTFARPWPIERTVELHRQVTGKPCVSVIVEIKSLRSTPSFLAAVVAALNARGVHVVAVASFSRDEIAGVSAVAQVVHGAPHPGPREVQFFHYAGDLQAACAAGRVEQGQSVMFNGASLLDASPGVDRPVYSTKLRVVAELDALRRRHGLSIGFYVQEGDCDHAAAGLLSDLCEARPETFELGFAWGGLRDLAHLEATGSPRLGYGSQRVLEYVGKARQWSTEDARSSRETEQLRHDCQLPPAPAPPDDVPPDDVPAEALPPAALPPDDVPAAEEPPGSAGSSERLLHATNTVVAERAKIRLAKTGRFMVAPS